VAGEVAVVEGLGVGDPLVPWLPLATGVSEEVKDTHTVAVVSGESEDVSEVEALDVPRGVTVGEKLTGVTVGVPVELLHPLPELVTEPPRVAVVVGVLAPLPLPVIVPVSVPLVPGLPLEVRVGLPVPLPQEAVPVVDALEEALVVGVEDIERLEIDVPEAWLALDVKLGTEVAEVHTLAVGVLDKLTDRVLLGVTMGDFVTPGVLVPETEGVWVDDPNE
jgi:hypothetical protein